MTWLVLPGQFSNPQRKTLIMTDHIRFVGARKNGSAIVHSLLRSGAFSADQISCCSAKDGTSEKLSQTTGISRFDS